MPWGALFTAFGYYVGAKLGFALTLHPVPVSTLWPPNAILLAGLTLTKPRRWPVVFAFVFVAHLAAQFETGVPARMVLSWFLSNSAEAMIGAALLLRFGGGARWFESFRGVAVFLVVVGCTAPFVSSFLDAALVELNGWGDSSYWTVWRTRFFSNALAALTLVPLILTTADGLNRIRQTTLRQVFEAIAGLLSLIAVCWVVFVLREPAAGSSPALLYMPLPILVAAAVRFGPFGASVSTLTCALIAIIGAVRGQGPFVHSDPLANALSIQLFLIVAWIPVMSLAAFVRERARADANARSSEEQLAVAIDAAQLGRWDWDIEAQRLTWCPITRAMYEVPPDREVNAQTYHALVHPEDRALLAAATADAIAGRGVDVEFRIQFPDGRIKWIHSKGRTVYDAEGRAVRLVGVKMDVTERKLAELQVQEQRRTLAHRARVAVAGEISTALAHEVNQPLAAILANASVARRHLRSDQPDLHEIGEIVEAIASDNRQAAAVITRFGDLLKKDEPQWTTLDINEVVAGFTDVARLDMFSRGVSVTKELTSGLPLVTGDAIQLQQVLLNMVINACEAMESLAPAERRLCVTTGSDGNGGVRVTVRDNGPGVTGDVVERLFDPFVTSKPQRPGLGLAICSSIVSAHRGQVGVENGPDGGAAFYFCLPAVVRPRLGVSAR
jgi:signal transduction histidine kinase